VARNPLEARSRERVPVLLHAPTGRDGTLVTDLLSRHGIEVIAVGSMPELDRCLDDAIGTILVAGEAIGPEAARLLRERLDGQPSWSDLSLIILTARGAGVRVSTAAIDALREQVNVTLLERPVQPATLLSAVRSALRARIRQYQVRDYLAERAQAEEHTRRMQRLDAVGKLAGGVAHEVNNMMTVVLGFGEFALQRVGNGHPAREDLQEMVRAGERAAAITQQLLAFSRQQRNAPTVLPVGVVVQELSTLLSKLLGAEYDLRLELPGELPLVRADRTQLEQVLVNLVLNARDATPPGGTVSLTAATAELDEAYAVEHDGVAIRSGSYAMIAVGDTGTGMTREVMGRAFEPFYTTKAVGQGSGLGLSTAYGIVKQNDGYIWLYSEPGLGTTVKIYLPTVAARPSVSRPASPAPAGGSERILVVEDEEMVRGLTRRTLESQGYAVLTAPNGEAALELLGRNPEPVDLVVCDLVMPVMNGYELGVRLASIAPGLPMLYMSGYVGQDAALRGLLPPNAPFIQKPFTPDGLGTSVRTVLESAAATRSRA
jgi:signal transduction histidine kinase